MAEEYEYTFKGKVHAEIDKIKAMDKKKRFNYFKSYYLGPVLVLLLLIGCLIWFLCDTVFMRVNPIYSGGMVNCNIPDDKLDSLETDFFNILGGNPQKEEVLITNDFYLTFAEEEESSAVQMEMSLYTLIAAGEFDFLLFDSQSVGHFQGNDIFKDVSDIIKGLDIDKEMLYYNDEGIPTAIKLPNNFTDKYQLTGYSQDVYVTFVDLGRTNEKDDMFLNFIFAK